VYSAEVLAGNVGNLEMYDTVSKAVIRVKREKIISVGHEMIEYVNTSNMKMQ
jgi:hypothetical protein